MKGVSGNKVDTSAGIVSLGVLGAICASGSARRILLLFPDSAAVMEPKGGFACTTLLLGWSPCVGHDSEGEADSTQTTVVQVPVHSCLLRICHPSIFAPHLPTLTFSFLEIFVQHCGRKVTLMFWWYSWHGLLHALCCQPKSHALPLHTGTG